MKWYDLTWPCKSPEFNLHHLQKISTGFKMVILTPNSGINFMTEVTYMIIVIQVQVPLKYWVYWPLCFSLFFYKLVNLNKNIF